MDNRLPPGISGYAQARLFGDRQAEHEMRQAHGLQGLLAQMQAQKQDEAIQGVLQSSGGDVGSAIPRLLQLGPKGAALAGQLEDRARQGALAQAQIGNYQRMEAADQRRAEGEARQQEAVGNLANALQGRPGYQTILDPDEAERKAIERGRYDLEQKRLNPNYQPEPYRTSTPNPATVQSLALQADPQRAIPEILRQQRPQQEKPSENIRAVTGGYLEKQPDGNWKFIKTAGEAAPAPSIVEIADPNDPSKSIKIDARTREKIGDAPRGIVGKPLPTKLQHDLIEKGQVLDASERFNNTFKDDYGGFVSDIVGNATLAAERRLSNDTGRAQWWQDYELHQSQVRNKLFGSALTAPEIAAWEKSAIAPGMTPTQIKVNLGRRLKIEGDGLTRLARSSGASYNKTAIEEAIGRPIPEAGSSAQPPVPTRSFSDPDKERRYQEWKAQQK